MYRPLFDQFPALLKHCHWVALADLPTPVRTLDVAGRLWIKHDDQTHPLYGGNKMRKLEFIVGEWRARSVREVVTFGAIGTNAGLATSLLCHLEGIACRVLLFDQPVSATVRANLEAMRRLGTRFEYCGSLAKAYLWYSLHPRRLRRDTYFLFAGCSNPPATLAYVNAALELAEQITAGQLPVPDEIVVPVGSSSTLAGLTLGCRIADLPTRVTGIRVVPENVIGIAACTPKTVSAQMRHAARLLGWEQTLPEPLLVGEYLGAGYGHATAAADSAIRDFGAAYGVPLEGTYSGKAAAYAIDRLAEGGGPLLFWSTFNSRPLGDLPVAPVQHAIPRRVLHGLGSADRGEFP